MSSRGSCAKWGRIVVLCGIALVALFPPLVSPFGMIMPGEFSFTGSRGFLLDPAPMVYYKQQADLGMAGNGTVVDTGRFLCEVVLLASIGLFCGVCGRCARREAE